MSFSATVTFVNPTDQPTAPWDYGLAFHLNQQASTVQEVYLDANGIWRYTDFPAGVQQSGVAPEFDQSPGGVNTIDLVVDGATALLGVNGAFVARIELPSVMTADVLAATDFVGGNVAEGREIIFSGFEVWSAPDLASPRRWSSSSHCFIPTSSLVRRPQIRRSHEARDRELL